jgi:hypothetical protein
VRRPLIVNGLKAIKVYKDEKPKPKLVRQISGPQLPVVEEDEESILPAE